MWTGKEEATAAPGAGVSLTEIEYRTEPGHRKSQAVYLGVRFCRTARGCVSVSRCKGLELRREVNP